MADRGVSDPIPLPEDPALRAAAESVLESRLAAEVSDARWRRIYVTPDFHASLAGLAPLPDPALGLHPWSTEGLDAQLSWPGGPTLDAIRANAARWGGGMLSTTAEGAEAVRALADPRIRDVVERLEPEPLPPAWSDRVEVRFGSGTTPIDLYSHRIDRPDGTFAGSVTITTPGVSGVAMGWLALGDSGHLERLTGLMRPARRPSAILFGDLEASTPLSRRLSTPAYFTLARRLARAADAAVVGAGGIVGRHVGDGVTALFLAEQLRTESAAARACITAARTIAREAAAVAERSGLRAEAVTMRFGLHWGATLYVGRLVSPARVEVTALGDEMNEAARIEACATGGRTLASKLLLERLERDDAAALGLVPDRIDYTPLGQLSSASAKARRDAPAVAVAAL